VGIALTTIQQHRGAALLSPHKRERDCASVVSFVIKKKNGKAVHSAQLGRQNEKRHG
jgi:hypothetical protein